MTRKSVPILNRSLITCPERYGSFDPITTYPSLDTSNAIASTHASVLCRSLIWNLVSPCIPGNRNSCRVRDLCNLLGRSRLLWLVRLYLFVRFFPLCRGWVVDRAVIRVFCQCHAFLVCFEYCP